MTALSIAPAKNSTERRRMNPCAAIKSTYDGVKPVTTVAPVHAVKPLSLSLLTNTRIHNRQVTVSKRYLASSCARARNSAARWWSASSLAAATIQSTLHPPHTHVYQLINLDRLTSSNLGGTNQRGAVSAGPREASGRREIAKWPVCNKSWVINTRTILGERRGGGGGRSAQLTTRTHSIQSL